jgi:cytochrome c oxidase assembly protein subunit 19
MGAAKQVVRAPQRGIFPLDHYSECRLPMKTYLVCLKENQDTHHKCRDLSKAYLQCRMDRELMSREDLDLMGYGDEHAVVGAKEYDNAKEIAGFVAGKHISRESKWWWERSGGKAWSGNKQEK